ncbi:MAG: FAD:protein FMN transferase [Clostridia bacterium]|nr:FAD:protein FMN transferase [Clostridia bacterium]
MKKIIFASLFLFILCGCSTQKYSTEYLDLFDTYSTVTIYTNNSEEFNEISNDLHKELLRLNRLFDIYNNYDNINNIKTINDNSGIKAVKADREIIELIKAGKEAYNKTEGTVNIAMGPVLKIWHRYRENALDNGISAIPDTAELEDANKHTDINNIIVDEENSTVFITDESASIDVGAIAKGYAADYAAEFLRSRGVSAALINLGGNVIALNDNSKKSWKTGIISPDNNGEYVDTADISNQSAVSSGNYQRYYEYEGKKYHHIIDGSTLMPAGSNRSVTVIADSSLEGDIFSTALFILPYEKGKRLAEENKIKALWVTADDKEYKTADFN